MDGGLKDCDRLSWVTLDRSERPERTVHARVPKLIKYQAYLMHTVIPKQIKYEIYLMR